MDIGDQSAAIDFLSRADSYGESGKVTVIETHISMVFLVGNRAFKLKRAVSLPYADFSSLALRRSCCTREYELNGRETPELYLGTRTITRQSDGTLAFDGVGEVIEEVVEMARFDQHDLFDRMAVDGRLSAELMEQTASMIAGYHANAPVRDAGSGAANMEAVLDINARGFATSSVFTEAEIAALNADFRRVWAEQAGVLDRRQSEGRVRLCHGDLHLRNIFMSAQGPRLFDCIDFNDQIATVDVLYDLAFLLMDLWQRKLQGFANIVANRYLDATGDDAGFGLLRFFMAVRAAVRAHVTATQREEGGGPELEAIARSYFDLARDLLTPQQSRLVAIGGLSGSGKSSLSAELAPRVTGAPGARLLESDRLRKAMFSVAVDERLPVEAYRPDVSQTVYQRLCDRANAVVSCGGSAIVNAVFERSGDREQIEVVARATGVPFCGIWLNADREVLVQRVRGRPQGASDATVDVLERQLEQGPGQVEWTSFDASQPLADVTSDVADWLREH